MASYTTTRYFVTEREDEIACMLTTCVKSESSPAAAWQVFLNWMGGTRREWQTKGRKFKARKFRVTIETIEKLDTTKTD